MGAWIVNKDLQKIQALMMMQMRLGQNMSNKKIAEAMNLNVETVERRFALAEKAGLFLDLEKELITNLVPKAMKAIETALEDGDSETALEILKSVGVLRDRKEAKTQSQERDDNDLFDAITAGREQRALNEASIDATIVGRGGLAGLLEQTTQPPTETSVAEDGDSIQSTVEIIEQEIKANDK